MRIVTLRALALSACFSMWAFTAPAEAQQRIINSKSPGGAVRMYNSNHGSAASAAGYHGHSHSGHSHGSNSCYGPGYASGFYAPFGSAYYSSYSNYYSPFGGSFYYGTVAPGFGYYNSTWGSPGGLYSYPTYQYIPTPVVVANYPPFTQPLIDAQAEAEARWAEELKLGSHIQIPIKPVVESSTQERLRAQRLQISGDELFRKNFFSQAQHQYRQANSVAQDLPGPYFRMAVVYAIQGKYDAAVTYLKRTLELDPSWPTRGDSLTLLYGEDNELARNALLIEVARWVEEDIRDPDRSFLMGVLLYEFDRENAVTFLETSARLSGTTQYVAPYLRPVAVDNPRNLPGPDDAAPPAEPLPEGEAPTPPLPQTDPTLAPEQPKASPKITPFPNPGVGARAPLPGQVVTPVYKSPLQGPELPPLGN